MQQVFSCVDKKSDTDHLSFLSNAASKHRFPFALWKLPHNEKKHMVISRQLSLLPRNTIIEELDKGFLFAPFERTLPTIFLPADFTFTFSGGLLQPPENQQEQSSLVWLKELQQKERTIEKKVFNAPGKKIEPANRHTFHQLIEKSIRSIENGAFEKVVVSRVAEISLAGNFDAVRSFDKLCEAYPNALITWISVPDYGDWLGATPEVLVCIENNSIFRTTALAGTQPYHEGVNIKSVAWTQKEIEEQALVSRYIINCFKQIRLREFQEQGPKTVIAGNLMHLKTDFMVDMKATNFPQLGSTMLQLLHPTSAVCGMPLQPALEFIRQNEGYEREFYSGYLGPVNFNNNIDIFVNLRCMQVLKGKALLYAGAGVTIDSIPEREWMETEIKLETLLKAAF